MILDLEAQFELCLECLAAPIDSSEKIDWLLFEFLAGEHLINALLYQRFERFLQHGKLSFSKFVNSIRLYDRL